MAKAVCAKRAALTSFVLLESLVLTDHGRAQTQDDERVETTALPEGMTVPPAPNIRPLAPGEDAAIENRKGREQGFEYITVHFRTVPALAFVPLGGVSSGQSPEKRGQASSYLGGPAVDLFNFTLGRQQVSLLNVSVFIVGINYTAIDNTGPGYKVGNVVYARTGPHVTYGRICSSGGAEEKGKPRCGWFGSSVGYGAMLTGDTVKGNTTVMHGLEVSLSVTVTDFLCDREALGARLRLASGSHF